MIRRLNIITLTSWSATILIAGCASHNNTPGWARQSSRYAPTSLSQGLPEKMPDILPQTHYAAGQLFESQGEYDKAIEQYRKVIAVNHNFASAYHRLGLALGSIGRHDEAVDAIGKAVELKSENSVYHNNLAYEFMYMNRWDDAEHELRIAIELQPSLHRAHINLALTVARSGQFDEALSEFKAALPEPDAYYNLGLLYRGQEKYAQAAETFRHVLELNPEFTAAKRQLDQVSVMIESRIAEQRKHAVAVGEPSANPILDRAIMPVDAQRKTEPHAEIRPTDISRKSDNENDALAAADALDHELAPEESPLVVHAQDDDQTSIGRGVWLSLVRFAQIVENESNCVRDTDDSGHAPTIEVNSTESSMAKGDSEQNEKQGLPVAAPLPELEYPCMEVLTSEDTDEDRQWTFAGFASNEIVAGPNGYTEIQNIPSQYTECTPLDFFAAMQNLGTSALENLPAVCADYPPLAVQAFTERFELELRAKIEDDQREMALRKEEWFHDFRNLDGLLAITENEVFCLDLFRNDELLVVMNSDSNANADVVAVNAATLGAAATPDPASPTEIDSEDMESSSIARAVGAIAPPADRN